MTTRPPIDSLITFLYTDDFDSSIQFYEHLLGFPLFLDQGTCRIYRVQGDAPLGAREFDRHLGHGGGRRMVSVPKRSWCDF